MQKFKPFEYMLINLANNFGLDKETYATRLQWANAHLDKLESLVQQADEPELFQKDILNIRRAQAKQATGTIVQFDAVCSGIQILSALTRCRSGAMATGLINTGVRPNAYLEVHKEMQEILGQGFDISYKNIKQCVMTAVYGSKQTPKDILGEGAMLNAFNRATKKVAPGAFAMLEILLATWNKEALYHEWKLPDSYQAHVKVLDQKIVRLEIDELDHYKMNTLVTVNAPLEFGLANIANVTHSIDAFVLREVIRYCSFSHEVLESYKLAINKELLTANRKTNSKINKQIKEINYYSINLLEQYSIKVLSKEVLSKLLDEIDFALQTKKSFQVLTIHDC